MKNKRKNPVEVDLEPTNEFKNTFTRIAVMVDGVSVALALKKDGKDLKWITEVMRELSQSTISDKTGLKESFDVSVGSPNSDSGSQAVVSLVNDKERNSTEGTRSMVYLNIRGNPITYCGTGGAFDNLDGDPDPVTQIKLFVKDVLRGMVRDANAKVKTRLKGMPRETYQEILRTQALLLPARIEGLANGLLYLNEITFAAHSDLGSSKSRNRALNACSWMLWRAWKFRDDSGTHVSMMKARKISVAYDKENGVCVSLVQGRGKIASVTLYNKHQQVIDQQLEAVVGVERLESLQNLMRFDLRLGSKWLRDKGVKTLDHLDSLMQDRQALKLAGSEVQKQHSTEVKLMKVTPGVPASKTKALQLATEAYRGSFASLNGAYVQFVIQTLERILTRIGVAYAYTFDRDLVLSVGEERWPVLVEDHFNDTGELVKPWSTHPDERIWLDERSFKMAQKLKARGLDPTWSFDWHAVFSTIRLEFFVHKDAIKERFKTGSGERYEREMKEAQNKLPQLQQVMKVLTNWKTGYLVKGKTML